MTAANTTATSNSTANWKAIAAVVLLKCAVLTWIIVDHARHLANGREIILDVVPVDPRSLFRGDYVILSTDAHSVPIEKLKSQPAPGTRDVFVVLTRAGAPANGTATTGSATNGSSTNGWRLKEAHGSMPAIAADEVVMRGRLIEMPASKRPGRIRYGIESYFVPEGKGREIERIIARVGPNGRRNGAPGSSPGGTATTETETNRVAVSVALDANGKAAIKALLIDGKPVYADPLL
jgi:uncharacterized membrane-anchored protein